MKSSIEIMILDGVHHGFVFVEPHENLDLPDCLRRADEAMYAMKKITHKER